MPDDISWDDVGGHAYYRGNMNNDVFRPEKVYTGIVWRAVELLPYRTTDEQFVKTCHQFGGLALVDLP